ncbi:histone deacetylase family protein [Algicella marina]|uniref:Histone deacetylase n=1 Tax=Algicella marina TaxID=2683284 RepID=A0A6P1SXK6_9RHOB|nr:histone deacetylase [Algicella marina]QHQ34497.1 histone deacetylase [Algicella marina]
MLPIVYHPDYMAPLKPGHRFPMSKYGYLRQSLIADGLLPQVGGYLAPAPARFSEIAACHAPDYVDRVFTQTCRPDEVRRIGLPDTERVARRARLSAAGTTLAARLALEHGAACNAAGGSHHAGPEGGAGFCVFNDVAVAARALLDAGQVSRVLILDLDVHQGDGTARIFADCPAVHTFSLHAERNYPAVKAVSDEDVALPDGIGDAAYLAVLAGVLPKLLAEVRPEIVFYNAGVDPHEADRLGRLSLSDAGLAEREAYVFATVRTAGIPVVGVLGGGYDTDMPALGARHAAMFRAAAAELARG